MAHSMKRRCHDHDYSSRCIYMVTLNKADGIPLFSEIYGGLGCSLVTPGVRYHSLGKLISSKIRDAVDWYPEVKVLQYVIMPDHVHLVIFITARVSYTLGKVVSRFTYLCNKANGGVPVFEEGYNDRIILKEGQLDTVIKYVRDNPRRLLIKRQHPDFFIRHHSVLMNGKRYEVFGNVLLLRHPFKEAVRVSSKFSAEELGRRRFLWDETIRQGGVLVSPFVSQSEREVRDRAVEGGASLIYLTKEIFGERFKPSGRLFELCSEGRLLMLSLGEDRADKKEMTRREALAMNDMAEFLAGATPVELDLRLMRR